MGDIAAAVDDDIRGDVAEMVQKLGRQLLSIGRVGEYILAFEHAEKGQVAHLFQGDAVLPDEGVGDMGRRENTSEGAFTL
ncbi:hypothetical protein SDC9_100668 [bioreactor metagenome]|uniref:Uncharacterized protein n=1 Tax=bioreactor metagenome TaxID=1076179 RepID=A0A645AMD4_9ZZZZ